MTAFSSPRARHHLSLALSRLSIFAGIAWLIMVAGAAFNPEPAPVAAPSTIEGRAND
jgi:hypothetical protein